MSRLAPKPRPDPPPPLLMQPRVEQHERADRFVFIHRCGQAVRTTVLPVGPSSWRWNREADTITPSISCRGCGLHGYWEQGRWRPA